MEEGIKREQLIHSRDIWIEVVTQDPVGKVFGVSLEYYKKTRIIFNKLPWVHTNLLKGKKNISLKHFGRYKKSHPGHSG